MSVEIQTHLANLRLFFLPALIETIYYILYILPECVVYNYMIVIRKKKNLKAKVRDCCQAELQ